MAPRNGYKQMTAVLVAWAVWATLTSWAGSQAAQTQDRRPDSAARYAVLLFKTGKTYAGQVIDLGHSYRLKLKTGSIDVPKKAVEAAFDSLEQAYLYKLSRTNLQDVDELIQLAKWCAEAGLIEQARAQARLAARLGGQVTQVMALIDIAERARRRSSASGQPAPDDPSASPPGHKARTQLQGDPAARNHVQIAHQQAQAYATPPAGAATASRPAHPLQSDYSTAGQAKLPPQSDELLQLLQTSVTPELLAKFTTQVQPLLLRSCARVGCHAGVRGGPSRFMLTVAPRPTRVITQRNLRAALSLIRPEDPLSSPLLSYATLPHGGSVDPPLLPTQQDAYRTLRNWILDVTMDAAEEADQVAEQAAPASHDRETSHMTSPQSSPAAESDQPTTGSAETTTQHATPKSPASESGPGSTPSQHQENVPAERPPPAGPPPAPASRHAQSPAQLPAKQAEPVDGPSEDVGSNIRPAEFRTGSSRTPVTSTDAGAARTASGHEATAPSARPLNARQASAHAKGSHKKTTKRLKRYTPVDPFDPELFNRRYHN